MLSSTRFVSPDNAPNSHQHWASQNVPAGLNDLMQENKKQAELPSEVNETAPFRLKKGPERTSTAKASKIRAEREI
jgi:hypothetical protein